MRDHFRDAYNESTIYTDALFDLVCGDLLGEGIHRRVYRHKLDPSRVVKFSFASDQGAFANVQEWTLWQRCRDTPYAKWLAPCRAISLGGIILIQDYVPDAKKSQLPKTVPAFLTDLKVANWGMSDRQPKCRDYANHLMMETGWTRRMRRADWWE